MIEFREKRSYLVEFLWGLHGEVAFEQGSEGYGESGQEKESGGRSFAKG